MKQTWEKEELKDIIIKHIAREWRASLGWGEDEKIITKACDELYWLLDPIEITEEDIISSINK